MEYNNDYHLLKYDIKFFYELITAGRMEYITIWNMIISNSFMNNNSSKNGTHYDLLKYDIKVYYEVITKFCKNNESHFILWASLGFVPKKKWLTLMFVNGATYFLRFKFIDLNCLQLFHHKNRPKGWGLS